LTAGNVNRKSSTSGFTLGELLVAIALVAILAAVIVPLFSSAREAGRMVRCASNMRQLADAFQLYLHDWGGCYPSPGGLVGNYNYWSQSGSGGLVPYVRCSGGIGTVWACPNLTEWTGPYPARSYSMNSYLRDPPDVEYPSCVSILKGMHESYLEDPRNTVLLFEGIPIPPPWPWPDAELYYIYRCGNWTCVRGWFTKTMPRRHAKDSWRPWHGSRSNFLFCDGHISSFTPNQYPKRPPYDTTNIWWVRKSAMAKKMAIWK